MAHEEQAITLKQVSEDTMGNFIISTEGKKSGFSEGYVDLPNNASVNHLSSPSKNCFVDKTGRAKTRPGYINTGINLVQATAAEPFYVKYWNVSFFSLNGKVYFVDHGNSDAVVDTGLSLDTTVATSFGEYAGDIYCTNVVDGLRQIHMGRVNESTADAGDGNIKVDQTLAGRLIAFSDTSGTLRIATSSPFTEAYSSVAGTGVITLSDTLNADVPDNTIVYTVEDISSGRPKGSHLTFWKERMIVWGVIDDQNTYAGAAVDNASNTVYMSKFATRDVLENVISFDTSGTATIEQIGKGGTVTDILATRDYLYIFTQTETYFSSVADVNATTGATLPQLLSNQHGCISPRCSVDLGNGKIAFVTSNKRIMGIGIATDTGAAVVFPMEDFDSPIRETLKEMNTGQTNIKVFYHSGEKRGIFQMRIDNAWTTFIYDNEIGRWQPPWDNFVFNGYYEIEGTLYATALNDDTVYEIGDIYRDDDGVDINTKMATGIFEFEDGRVTCEWKEVELSGSMTRPTTITVEAKVDQMDGTNKEISSDGLTFSSGNAIGLGTIGDETIGGMVEEQSGFANFSSRKAIYPTYAGDIQFILSTSGEGAAFTWDSFRVRARSLDRSLLTLT